MQLNSLQKSCKSRWKLHFAILTKKHHMILYNYLIWNYFFFNHVVFDVMYKQQICQIEKNCHQSSLWFWNLPNQPNKMFSDYTHDQITTFLVYAHQKVSKYMVNGADDKIEQREIFNRLFDQCLIFPRDQYTDLANL